ncbi:MAG: hypothetical protein GF353_06115 [Candidatus Lokiarchaeota archaeon]|nr:hypothetical protein [Candidatus Lokiarchaeota archaeon]
MTEVLYFKIFNENLAINSEISIQDLIEKIESKLNKKLNIIDEIHEWRKIRNKIVHEHFKVDKELAEKALGFFNRFNDKFTQIFYQFS